VPIHKQAVQIDLRLGSHGAEQRTNAVPGAHSTVGPNPGLGQAGHCHLLAKPADGIRRLAATDREGLRA